MKTKPVMFRWCDVELTLRDGKTRRVKVMVPHQRFWPLCERQFSVDEDYPLSPVENRSMRSHNHYFAALGDAFDNLPEAWAQEFPSAEHMRKWVLIECGYFHLEEYDFDTEKDAKAFATGTRRRDEYCRIKRVGTTIIVKSAKSQDHSMKAEEFQKSKTDVLDYCSQIIGVRRAELEKVAEKTAPKMLTNQREEDR